MITILKGYAVHVWYCEVFMLFSWSINTPGIWFCSFRSVLYWYVISLVSVEDIRFYLNLNEGRIRMPVSFSLIKSKENTNQTCRTCTKQTQLGKFEELWWLYCLFIFFSWEMWFLVIIKFNCFITICEWIILLCKIVLWAIALDNYNNY